MSETTRFTTVSVTHPIRDELRCLKQDGDSYSDLLLRMLAQYEPDKEDQ